MTSDEQRAAMKYAMKHKWSFEMREERRMALRDSQEEAYCLPDSVPSHVRSALATLEARLT